MKKILMIAMIILAFAACARTEVLTDNGGERLSKVASYHIFEDYGNRL